MPLFIFHKNKQKKFKTSSFLLSCTLNYNFKEKNLLITQPPINILTIRIEEPVTLVTDIFISALCFFAFFKLKKQENKSKAIQYFQLFFLCLATGTLLSGLIGHSFKYLFAPSWKIPGWLMSGISVTFLELAAIEFASSILKPRTQKILFGIVISQLTLYFYVALNYLNFFYTALHIAIGLLGLTTFLATRKYLIKREQSSANMLLAGLFFASATAVFLIPIIPHKWFNHMDLSHLFIAGSAYFYYRSAKHINLEGVAEERLVKVKIKQSSGSL